MTPPPQKKTGLKFCWIDVRFVSWSHLQNFRPLGTFFLVEVEFLWWGRGRMCQKCVKTNYHVKPNFCLIRLCCGWVGVLTIESLAGALCFFACRWNSQVTLARPGPLNRAANRKQRPDISFSFQCHLPNWATPSYYVQEHNASMMHPGCLSLCQDFFAY